MAISFKGAHFPPAFEAEQATLAGIELTHMLRQGQLTRGQKMRLTVAEQLYILAAYGPPQGEPV